MFSVDQTNVPPLIAALFSAILESRKKRDPALTPAYQAYQKVISERTADEHLNQCHCFGLHSDNKDSVVVVKEVSWPKPGLISIGKDTKINLIIDLTIQSNELGHSYVDLKKENGDYVVSAVVGNKDTKTEDSFLICWVDFAQRRVIGYDSHTNMERFFVLELAKYPNDRQLDLAQHHPLVSNDPFNEERKCEQLALLAGRISAIAMELTKIESNLPLIGHNRMADEMVRKRKKESRKDSDEEKEEEEEEEDALNAYNFETPAITVATTPEQVGSIIEMNCRMLKRRLKKLINGKEAKFQIWDTPLPKFGNGAMTFEVARRLDEALVYDATTGKFHAKNDSTDQMIAETNEGIEGWIKNI